MKKILRYALVFPLTVLLFASCDNNNGGTDNDFDRKEMLKDYAETIIQPSFYKLIAFSDQLDVLTAQFGQNPTQSNLDLVKDKFKSTYLAFQEANAFNFGPTGENGLLKGMVEEIGTFPASPVKIEEIFLTPPVLFGNDFNRDTRGFAAMDYLLYNINHKSILEDPFRRSYFKFVVGHCNDYLKSKLSAIETYLKEFSSNNGTDAGSSTSLLYNEFVRNFEAAKNFKVGLPTGKRPGQNAPVPEICEGYYAGNTLDLLKANLLSIEHLYTGDQGQFGFDDYLQAVVGGPELVTATNAQWAKVILALNNVPTNQPFSVLVEQKHPSIDSLHTELQRHTRFFKSEMSSVLGIAITFSSGDGD